MNAPKFRLIRSVFFIAVLLVKVFISVSPVFASIRNQDDIQIEKESKNDKDESEKEFFKLKSFIDKDFFHLSPEALIASSSDIKNIALFTHPIYCPDHLATVHTPPPDKHIA